MEKISYKDTILLIKGDLVAYAEPFWKAALFIPGFKYTLHHRLCYYFYCHKIYLPLFVIWRLYMYHLTWKFGIQMDWNRKLPARFTISHFGGITFMPESCGEGVYLRQGCTVGRSGRGDGRFPRIGNNVEFGANVCVVGDIEIGDHAKLGAGAVVTKDVPPYAVVGGVPAHIIRILPHDN